MKVLFFGDIVGKIGRKAVIKILPELKKEFKPDLILANGENLAHGKGLTFKTAREVLDAGIDGLTGGNHFWSKKEDLKKVLAEKMPVIRPANYSRKLLGESRMILKAGKTKVLVINLIGQAFIKDKKKIITNPFKKIAKILSKKPTLPKIILVDFHAEATAEKVSLGHFLNGKVSAVVGTHTHIPTADERILDKGTAYISDVGMVGEKDSVIGDIKEPIIKHYLTDCPLKFDVAEAGLTTINAVLITINPRTGQAEKIERIKREVVI